MKERAIKIGILSVVFILAIFAFSHIINRGNAGTSADMGAATLPVLSFVVEGKEVNPLVGHKKEMDMVSLRDTIVVYGEDNELTLNIKYMQEEVTALTYEVYTTDGTKKLHEGAVKQVKEKVKLPLENALRAHGEGMVKITLIQGDTTLYYYVRIVKDHNYHIKECLEYVEELHTNILKKQNENDVKKVMESNAEGDNTTLQHVTIHSDLNHIMWGDLKPKRIGELCFEIKEVQEAYTSILLQYQVKSAGDNNEEEIYNVKEFFKVAYGTKRMYLLEYDRTVEENFRTSNVVLSGKGVILGIAKADMPYEVNKDGTIVTFVQNGELWNYNKEEDAFSLIFSFVDSEREDVRNYTDNHSIQILSMEDNGNVTFTVCGYMNRGVHEGESGIAIYYYNSSQNSVEEAAFIPSKRSRAVIERELHELAYYNKEQDVLYVMADGTLQKIDMKKDERTVLVENLQRGQYVASANGHLLAHQKNVNGKIVTEVWNFTNDKKQDIPVQAGEVIVPLGFVENDFVYGISQKENVGQDASGTTVQAMHRLEIRDANQEVVKTYEEPNVYILGVSIDKNVITLRQGVKEGSSYREISEDYITNTETVANDFVTLESYWTDLKQTQYRLTFKNGIRDKKAKTLKPKQVLQESVKNLEFEDVAEREYFYVYGLGEQAGVFEEAGEAIKFADKLSGVVISSKSNYVWEDGNRESWYHNFDVRTFTAKEGQNTLAACVEKVLAYEGESVNVATEMTTKTPKQILSEQLKTEAVQFRGCSVKDMFYLIDKRVPVIALKDSSRAVLLVGYDAKTVTYIDPASGATRGSTIEDMDAMLSGSGRTFIGYIK